jgi:hypothetical protein
MKSPSPPSCPLSAAEIIEQYFMEHRAKLIDIAAFFDRWDRARDAKAAPTGKDDFRVKALRAALEIARDDKPNRACRVLELFSDPTSDPIAKAPMKGALGAHAGFHSQSS